MKKLNRQLPKFKSVASEDKSKSPEAKAALDTISDLEKKFKKLIGPYNNAEKFLYDVTVTLTDKQYKDAVKKAKDLQEELIKLRQTINEKRANFKENYGKHAYQVISSIKSNSPEIDKLIDQADKLQKQISVMEKPIYKGTATKEVIKNVADKYGDLSVLVNKISKLMSEETSKLVTKASIKPNLKQLVIASFKQLANIETALAKAKQDQIKALETQNDGIRKQIENLNKQLDNKNLSKEQKDSIHDRLDTLKDRRRFNSNKILDLRD
jgi:chromosome segregation ATPase